MGSVETPAAARRRVRLALRGAREALGLTQGMVAQAMDWSLSKVMRIEKGEVNISPGDLRALLDHLDVRDPTRITVLLDDARRARSERHSVEPRYREHLTLAMLQFMQYERSATAVRFFNPTLVPAVFQTERYAETVLGVYAHGFSPEAIRTRIDARFERRRRLVDDSDRPTCFVVVDESVLYREVGGPDVIGEQLLELLELIKQDNIRIRVLPFTEPAPIAFLGPFSIVDMGDGQDPVLYREGPRSDEIAVSRRDIDQHVEIFEWLWSGVYGDAESEELIRVRAAAMLDRR
jgi:transcriptional regulator with XRE-family HTH domain